ncbi:MAG: hypothetical protein C0514_07245 [Candidatus Puniceispirillum sp.]|nr:hypothetical protein [Candidatus Puniceispirillum sp.]
MNDRLARKNKSTLTPFLRRALKCPSISPYACGVVSYNQGMHPSRDTPSKQRVCVLGWPCVRPSLTKWPVDYEKVLDFVKTL